MPSKVTRKEDTQWEKEHAPRVTRGKLSFALIVFGIWIAFLAVVSVERWFGALQ